MVILVDIDGTLCPEGDPSSRRFQKPFPGAVEAINRYVANGHTVVIWTGRGWNEYLHTKEWLDSNGFKYAQLLMGKPIANLIIDDRAKQFKGWDKDYISSEE